LIQKILRQKKPGLYLLNPGFISKGCALLWRHQIRCYCRNTFWYSNCNYSGWI